MNQETTLFLYPFISSMSIDHEYEHFKDLSHWTHFSAHNPLHSPLCGSLGLLVCLCNLPLSVAESGVIACIKLETYCTKP